MFNVEFLDTFADGGITAGAGTVINYLVQPFLGKDRSMKALGQAPFGPFAKGPPGRIRLTKLLYSIGTASHNVFFMRPLNFTTVAAAAAAGAFALSVVADPGIYSLNYRYPNAAGLGMGTPWVANPASSTPVDVADRSAMGVGDWIAYQIGTGLFVLDQITSGTFASFGLTNAIPTTGVPVGALVYLFGTPTSLVPYTRLAHTKWQPDVTTAYATITREYPLGGDGIGLYHCFHPGDPLMIQSSNGTVAGNFQLIAGGFTEW